MLQQIESASASFTGGASNPPEQSTAEPGAATVCAVALPHQQTEQLVEATMSTGLHLRHYATLDSLLDGVSATSRGCLVVWSQQHTTQTVAAVHQLRNHFRTMPIIVLYGADHNLTTVTLMQAGAFSVLGDAATRETLADTLVSATALSRQNQTTVDEGCDSLRRLQQATGKELEVLDLIMSGRKNREIAAILGITVRAVEDRRFRLMKKVETDSVAELVAVTVRARYYEQGFLHGGWQTPAQTPTPPLKGIEVWTPDDSESCLSLSQSCYRDAGAFRDASDCMTFGKGEGLPGTIWESRAPAFLRELVTTTFMRTQVASAAGMTTAVGFPVFRQGRIEAVVLFLLDTRYQMRAAFEAWCFDESSHALRLTGGTYVNCERLRRLSEFMAFPIGKGLPGMAAARRRPCAAASFAEDPAVVRGVALSSERLTSGIALPLTDSGAEVDDVLLCFHAESSPAFSIQQIWEPSPDAQRLLLTSEYIDGIPTLATQLKFVNEMDSPGIAAEAFLSESAVLTDSVTGGVLCSRAERSPSSGIAIPTFVDGRVVAVTVLAD